MGEAGAMATLHEVAAMAPLVFPVHPRTRRVLEQAGVVADPALVKLVEPLGYLDFLSLQAGAALVLTDSGGVQEETSVLGVPCLTLRENTERPITVTRGTNTLVQGVVLITASAYVLINLLVDVSYSLLNPRIRIKGAVNAR